MNKPTTIAIEDIEAYIAHTKEIEAQLETAKRERDEATKALADGWDEAEKRIEALEQANRGLREAMQNCLASENCEECCSIMSAALVPVEGEGTGRGGVPCLTSSRRYPK